MASLKKEVAALLSRFDAAQEAFVANTADTKKLQKQHKKALKQSKKELKGANKTIAKLEEQVADLKKELQDAKQELTLTKAKVMDTQATPKSTPSTKGKRGPGRPRKSSTAKPTAATKTTAKGATVTKEGTNQVPVAPVTPPASKKTTTRRSNAASKKATSSKPATGAAPKKRGPGRPRKNPPTPDSPLRAVKGVGPAMARAFEAAGVKTPADMAGLSDDKMRDVLNGIGRRYNNPSDEMIAEFKQSAKNAS